MSAAVLPSALPNAAVSDDEVRLTPHAPELRVSFAEGNDHDAAVAQATAVLRREGVVVLDDLVDPGLLERCRSEIVARYPDYDRPDRERYLGSYPGRHTAPLVIDQTLADPAIFAPRAIRDIGANLLGPEHILESLGLLVSLPGALNQGVHFDGMLFSETKFDFVLPAVAISISLPLVHLDEVSGTTAFWRGSHRRHDMTGPPDFAPVVPVGSAIVWDFRVLHSGRGNCSGTPRPILFSVHSREWWQEPNRARSFRYRKLQVARAVHAAFGRPMRDFTVRADVVDDIPAR